MSFVLYNNQKRSLARLKQQRKHDEGSVNKLRFLWGAASASSKKHGFPRGSSARADPTRVYVVDYAEFVSAFIVYCGSVSRIEGKKLCGNQIRQVSALFQSRSSDAFYMNVVVTVENETKKDLSHLIRPLA
ncbi:hypothetical protein EV213_11244 [Aureibacillus halotolerans]|uniref:Uncharacterized protein n=1 Tax=Aureibacillus halotolerans TaxID=1508390 RepID=A0A4R6U3J5_9BACI|nr:hypothetical protein EV213_11244 [Aureibacillus halotolerans]